jgi:phosphatidylglycerol:prolipoprotein diacylglycerol transferase
MLIHPEFDPVAFHIGPIVIRWYGLTYVVAFAFVHWLALKRIHHPSFSFPFSAKPWERRDVEDILLYGMFGAVVGARLGHCLFYNPVYYFFNPLEVFAVWKGGESFHGGLIGVMCSYAWISHRRKSPYFELADLVAPCIPLGLASGRLGNFINGELWGRVASPDLPWGMVFRGAGDLPRHPSQIYQFLMEGVLHFVLLWMYAKKPRKTGQVSAMFLIIYSVSRFIVEFFREPDAHLRLLALGLTMGQWLCVPMLIGGAGLWWWAHRRNTPQTVSLPRSAPDRPVGVGR